MKKRVLNISTVGMNYEGITSVIYNYASNIQSKDLNIEFIAWNGVRPELKDKFEKIGPVSIVNNRRKSCFLYVKDLYRLLRTGFDVVHIHGNSGTMLIEVVLAKISGVKRIILHSHTTTCSHPYMDKMMRPLMYILATDYLACSEAAGKWLYGNRKFTVLNNAIEIDNFAYNPNIREEVRSELRVTDEFLIGHVGHFTTPKNHEFLIDVFYELHYRIPNSKLLLVSDGELFEDIKNKVKKLGMEDAVIFAGRRADVNRLYQAMDIFVLPSRWEGLSLVTVEAQTADLPVLVSDAVPREARCTKNVRVLSLEQGVMVWAEELENILLNAKKRDASIVYEIQKKGFDIKKEVKKLEEIYKA